MIRINKLEKSFGNNHVLKGIETEFEAGRVYGIVGVNGAGKTTFFECISGLIPFDGTIESPWENMKNHVGLLLTNPYFFPLITGKEYIQLMCNASGVAMPELESYNLFDLPLKQYAISYSTGMKKKLAITALLMLPKDVFILDEPFNGVDIQSNMLIKEIIHRLKDSGKTVLVSSHIFSSLKETCDEMLVLENGNFSKVTRTDFDALEKKMKEDSLKNKLDALSW